MSVPITDAKARTRALDPSHSFICAAPAGSGKTELLTQRFLTLLTQVNEPESVIAITFTRKAAAEMRDRILNAIKRAARLPRPQSEHEGLTWDIAKQVLDRDRIKQWSLLAMPNRLQIKTLDSLCSSLANSLTSHTSFASPPLITHNPGELYRQAAYALLQSLEDDQPWSIAIGQLLLLMDNNTQKLASLLSSMLFQREAWLPIIGSGNIDTAAVKKVLQSNLQRVRDDTVAKLTAAIQPYHRQTLLELAKSAAEYLVAEDNVSPIVNCIDLDRHSALPGSDDQGVQQWLGLTELLLRKDNNWRKTVDRRVGFPSGKTSDEKALCKQRKQQWVQLIDELSCQSGLLDLLVDIRYLPGVTYNEDQASLLDALLKVLPALVGYLQVEFSEIHSVDFAEVSIRARSALIAMGSPTELALLLDYKIQHLLVDEFQDVSSAQFELLTLLISGWQPGDGRSLFLVGDPMQSIYGFRNANVGLFLQCREDGIGDIPLEPLYLSTNFRSQAAIVKWINRVFSQSFPGQDDIAIGAVSYLNSEPIHPPLSQRAVYCYGFTEETSKDDEARTVLDIVRQNRFDAPDRSIAILVRNRHHAVHIISLLDEMGLAYRAVDFDALADNMVIQDLVSLTRALLHPADKIAWLSILRAPWCGLSLADLEVIVNVDGQKKTPFTLLQQLVKLMASRSLQPNLVDEKAVTDSQEVVSEQQSDASGINEDKANSCNQSLSEDGWQRLARVVPVLELCVTQTHRQSLRQWIEGAWITLGGPACITNNRDVKNAERYFSLLESLDLSALIKDSEVLQQAVETLYAEPDPESDGKLQIMTIHKAKGLEFDTVIIPGLERSLRSLEPELLRWDERLSMDGEPLLLMAPITSSGKERDSIYNHLALQQRRRQLNENTRLLYVACTRARHHLHLLAQVKIDDKDTAQLRQPAQSSLLYTVWPTVKLEIQCHQQAGIVEGKGIPESANYLQRLSSQWQFPFLRQEHLLADYIPYHQYDNSQQLLSCRWQDPTSRYVGILVHRILQHVTLAELHALNWRHRQSHWFSQLQSLGTPAASLVEATEKVITTLERVSMDKSVHWLFTDTHPQRKTEYPITLASKKGAEHYIIDLLLFDGDHTWIIDYKTSHPQVSQAVPEFVEQELTAYRDIMHRYKKAIGCMGYKKIRSALYFPMINYFADYN